MALQSGPYYTNSSQVVHDLDVQDLHNGQTTIYPDLCQSTAPDSHMYALADDALQAHNDTASHLAGLIQAATAAAGQDDTLRRHSSSSPSRFKRTTRKSQGLRRDLRHSSAEEQEELQYPRGYETVSQSRNTRKRKRISDDGAEMGSDNKACSDVQQSLPGAQVPVSLSTNALFRRPLSSNKKYTRPPVHKLYTSLELSPDNFLQLQCAAKNYMLDESHPERRDAVGQRGKADSELAKLRLWNCVKEFLDKEGNGDRFFGPHVPGDEGQVRTMFWPSHKNNLISEIMPLLRRMVTNERQRQYAIQSRKAEAVNKKRSDEKQKQDLPYSQIGQEDLHALERARRVEADSHDLSSDMIQGICDDSWRNLRNPSQVASLQAISTKMGLSDAQLNELVATIEHHLRVSHTRDVNGGRSCNPGCESAVVDHILEGWNMGRTDWTELTHNDYGHQAGLTPSTLKEIFAVVRDMSANDVLNQQTVAVSTNMSEDHDDLGGSLQNDFAFAASESGSLQGTRARSLVLQVSILTEGKRLRPRFDIPATNYTDLNSFLQKVVEQHHDATLVLSKVKVLLPHGLVEMRKDSDWAAALYVAETLDWMDGELKVLIEL